MTEKEKSQQKRKYHCACAIGDLSASEPATAPSSTETNRQPDTSGASSTPAAGAAPRVVDQKKTTGSRG